MQRPATVRHRTSLFEDATAIVAIEFADDLSLDDIARRVASSRRQLQRAYAEIGNTTFREHLTAVRMDSPPSSRRPSAGATASRRRPIAPATGASSAARRSATSPRARPRAKRPDLAPDQPRVMRTATDAARPERPAASRSVTVSL